MEKLNSARENVWHRRTLPLKNFFPKKYHLWQQHLLCLSLFLLKMQFFHDLISVPLFSSLTTSLPVLLVPLSLLSPWCSTLIISFSLSIHLWALHHHSRTFKNSIFLIGNIFQVIFHFHHSCSRIKSQEPFLKRKIILMVWF